MIFRFGEIIFIFLRSIFLYKFNKKEKFPELYYSGYCLFKDSFRYPSRSKSDFLISFKIFKNIIFSLFFKNVQFLNFEIKNGVAIIDGSLNSSKMRTDYIRKFSGLKTELVISKDHLLNYYSFSSSVIIILFLFLCFLPIFLLSFFSINKLTYPLLVREVIECFILNEILLKYKIKELFYFNIYERDSNIIGFFLMSRKIHVTKIPSEVPICFWNKIIIANTLCVCFPYQLDEYNLFKKTIFVDQIKNWGPERILNAPKYVFEKNKNNNKPKYKIGYYSSGYWLRSKIGNVSLGDYFSLETELMKILDEYAKIFNIQIIFYLHPKELKEDNLALTKNHYSQIDKNKNIHISFDNIPSVLTLNDVDLGISIKSTLMFERIYYGYKTLFYCFKRKDFPIKKSSLENIFIDKRSFNETISKSLSFKTSEFFDHFDIMNYSKYLGE